ncbi:MAG: ABC transporter substrate-binding protein [Spirochaetaceae bacterium]
MEGVRSGFLATFLIFVVFTIKAGGSGEGELPPFEERFRSMSWEEIVAEAEGQTLYWHMWGGSDVINRFAEDYVGGVLEERYGIDLEMVPVTDASVFVNKVLGEKQAGRDSGGSVDIMWINGENFRTMREADLLFGPYAEQLPNIEYVNLEDPSIANDFGYPVNGYESPYGTAQVVMIYNSDDVPEPPRTVGQLLQWIRANPRMFAYAAPPDFTGSAFVRHIFYYAAGGYERLLGPFDQEVYDEVAPLAWEILNEIEPYLWRGGETYPESRSQVLQLYANGELYFDVAYNPNEPANLVAQGRYPESTRSFVFDGGTIGNTHYVAIAYNSPHKAAAMVLANLLLSPEVQLEKARPEAWGDPPAIDVSKLPAEWRARFEELPTPPAVVPPEVRGENKLPELQSEWLEAIERGWRSEVLEK